MEKVEQGFKQIFGGVFECGEISWGIFSKEGAAEHLYLLDAARDVLLDHQQDPLYEAV